MAPQQTMGICCNNFFQYFHQNLAYGGVVGSLQTLSLSLYTSHQRANACCDLQSNYTLRCSGKTVCTKRVEGIYHQSPAKYM
mmetsp:Transcript_71098/g.104195  ORF Transcript_71098/g.104195 Transcript_71098/m.104195 type:complete len:82 (+) Transcript_71098:302-547(+)